METQSKTKYWGAIAFVLLVVAITGWFTPRLPKAKDGVSSGAMNAEDYNPYIQYNGGYNSNLPITSAGLITGNTLLVGSSSGGTTMSKFIAPANCTVIANANTIVASSTKDVDCTVTGVVSTDTVFAVATTSISTASNGVAIVASRASTTPGYVTLTLSNLTGGTFTWTGAASTSIKVFPVK